MIFGRPLKVGPAHVPANGELADDADGAAAADEADEDDDEDEEEVVVPVDAVTLEGAVGTSKSVLFWKPQAFSRTEPRRVAISVMFRMASLYSLGCARTIFVGAKSEYAEYS